MEKDVGAYEVALRRLPLTYSLALRLRDAGVAPEVISEYLGIDEASLDSVYRVAEDKLTAATEAQLPEPADQPVSSAQAHARR